MKLIHHMDPLWTALEDDKLYGELHMLSGTSVIDMAFLVEAAACARSTAAPQPNISGMLTKILKTIEDVVIIQNKCDSSG